MAEQPFIAGSRIRELRETLELSAESCAQMVGISDGAGWRRWERDGVKGTAAVLLEAMIELPSLRRYLKQKFEAIKQREM